MKIKIIQNANVISYEIMEEKEEKKTTKKEEKKK